jgi:hypothetical protein
MQAGSFVFYIRLIRLIDISLARADNRRKFG